MSTVGVIVALMAIAFDPFAQQLAQNKVYFHYADDPDAQLPIARRFSLDRILTGSHGNVSGALDDCFIFRSILTPPDSCKSSEDLRYQYLGTDFGTQAAVIHGLSQTGGLTQTIQQLSPKCSSGNCTWAPVTSLAVCSACTQIELSRSYATSEVQQWMHHRLPYIIPQLYNKPPISTAFRADSGLWIQNMDGWSYPLLSTNNNLTTNPGQRPV